jgi:hypothetical protein
MDGICVFVCCIGLQDGGLLGSINSCVDYGCHMGGTWSICILLENGGVGIVGAWCCIGFRLHVFAGSLLGVVSSMCWACVHILSWSRESRGVVRVSCWYTRVDGIRFAAPSVIGGICSFVDSWDSCSGWFPESCCLSKRTAGKIARDIVRIAAVCMVASK